MLAIAVYRRDLSVSIKKYFKVIETKKTFQPLRKPQQEH